MELRNGCGIGTVHQQTVPSPGYHTIPVAPPWSLPGPQWCCWSSCGLLAQYVNCQHFWSSTEKFETLGGFCQLYITFCINVNVFRCACGEFTPTLCFAAIPQQQPGEFLPAVGGTETNTYVSKQHCSSVEWGQRWAGSEHTSRVVVCVTYLESLLCWNDSPLVLFAGLIFYDTKVTVMNRVLNATVQRTADHAAPEITLDPLEIVGGGYSFHWFMFFSFSKFNITSKWSIRATLRKNYYWSFWEKNVEMWRLKYFQGKLPHLLYPLYNGMCS